MRIGQVTPADLTGWLSALDVGNRRKENLRRSTVTLFKWARARDYLPDRTTAAERVERFKTRRAEVEIYTPEEVSAVLREVSPRWLAAVALGAFAGVRQEEMTPESGELKPALGWGDIRWERREIYVPAKWLEPFRGREGRVCNAPPFNKNEAARLRKKGVKLVKNGFRHSYGSYRMAESKNAPRVSEEMGNSAAVIKSNYDRGDVSEDAAEGWFSVTPDAVQRVRLAG